MGTVGNYAYRLRSWERGFWRSRETVRPAGEKGREGAHGEEERRQKGREGVRRVWGDRARGGKKCVGSWWLLGGGGGGAVFLEWFDCLIRRCGFLCGAAYPIFCDISGDVGEGN